MLLRFPTELRASPKPSQNTPPLRLIATMDSCVR